MRLIPKRGQHRRLGMTRRPLGLRARVTAAFAFGACILSVFLAASTYLVVRHTLVDQREEFAANQTYLNARPVLTALRQPRTDVSKLLGTLENPTGSHTLIYSNERWYPASLEFTQSKLPQSFIDTVNGGKPAQMVFKTDGQPQLAIGVPLPSVGGSYYEISELDELERTLRILLFTLVVASIFTTLGGAALGRWASRLVLRPVTEAASAAEAISAGDTAARLHAEGDTDLDRLALSFNRMVDALQRRIQRDARFASDVSHELRSPLMTLASGLSVMQSRRADLPERSQTALDLLADEVQRFQRMVQDLLEISRSDAGQTDVVFDEVLVGEFVTRVCERYEQEIPIEAETGVDQVIISVDKRRMERVIGNLIENAERYAGGVKRIGIEWAGKDVRIVVDDDGPGVPEEERERIFERFARGATARARASGEGTGLGLSLVAEHVKLHSGTVWVQEAPSGGARFIVELPRIDA